MSKMERTNGRFEKICNSVFPGKSTSCSHLVRDGKRYLVFDQERYCCICCDAAHGCDILSRDWLKGADYHGKESISGEEFDKWSKLGNNKLIQMMGSLTIIGTH